MYIQYSIIQCCPHMPYQDNACGYLDVDYYISTVQKHGTESHGTERMRRCF